MIVPRGAVVLFDDGHPDDVPDNAWNVRYRALRHRHGDANVANARRRAGGWLRHEAILLDSAFSVLDSVGVIERRRLGAAELVHRALSMSSTTAGSAG